MSASNETAMEITGLALRAYEQISTTPPPSSRPPRRPREPCIITAFVPDPFAAFFFPRGEPSGPLHYSHIPQRGQSRGAGGKMHVCICKYSVPYPSRKWNAWNGAGGWKLCLGSEHHVIEGDGATGGGQAVLASWARRAGGGGRPQMGPRGGKQSVGKGTRTEAAGWGCISILMDRKGILALWSGETDGSTVIPPSAVPVAASIPHAGQRTRTCEPINKRHNRAPEFSCSAGDFLLLCCSACPPQQETRCRTRPLSPRQVS